MLRSGHCRCNGAKMMAGQRDNSHTSYVKMAERVDPLLVAAAGGFPLLVRIQIARNKDINSQDVFGRTALHLAVLSGHIEIIQILIKHGAKVDVEDSDGYTPLCSAVLRQSTEIVELLIKAGATPNDRNSLLHFSVKCKNFDITKLLLSAGSNPNSRDGNQETPLMIAATTNDIAIATILLGAGQDEILDLLLMYGADVRLQDVNGRTALHRAVEAGHIGIVKHLCQLCPELVHIRDKYNKLSYDYAFGKKSIQETLSKFS